MRMSGWLVAFMSIGVAVCAAARDGAAQGSVAEFYKGKRVTILVGFTAGGSSSLYAQSLSRHMSRHMPGNPEFLVQNMPGAGGLVVANHVYNNAPRDGTVFAITGRTAAIEPLLGNKNAKFDAQKFFWLGTANVEYTTCVAWHTAPAKTLAEAMEKEVIVGGSGSDATEVVFPKAANKLVGTKFKVVTGYHGSTEINLAMERGEAQGFCGIGWTFLKLRKADWLRDKKVNILFQLALRKHPDLPDVPLILDHTKTAEGRKIFEFLLAPQEMGRPFFAPPGVPADRVQALRTALEKTLKDPQYLAEAEKLGIEVQHVGGEAIHELLARIYSSPPELIEQARNVAR